METGTAQSKQETKSVPPYVAFATFKTFVQSLRVAIPSRIDRSVMSSMSGAVQTQMLSALRYLDLVSENGLPTERLNLLVHAEGEDWQKQLQALLSDKYPFLFAKLDLTRATSRQFEEAFSSTGTASETARKCMGFFLAAAKDAELTLSPHIKPYRSATLPKAAGRQRRAIQPPTNHGGGAADNNPEAPIRMEPPAPNWAKLLLSKFPDFDPAWSDDVKAKWFDAFDKLMKRGEEP